MDIRCPPQIFSKCFTMGKGPGLRPFPNCRPRLSCLVLDPLFCECTHLRASEVREKRGRSVGVKEVLSKHIFVRSICC